MRGVIMSAEGKYAVLLTKNGDFVKVKNKNYSAGDTPRVSSNASRICAMAASLVIVCAGIGSYFTPAGYVSVDINPSLMMTVNIYNRVIDVKSLNDDARVLLNKTDIKGKSAEDAVDMLIKKSEEIGYINDDNRSVILDVVSGIREPNIEDISGDNVDIIKETADMETFRLAENIGVSVAKAKAIGEYTDKNGGDMLSNAAALSDKSVKEIRNITDLSDKTADNMPLRTPIPREKSDIISDTPKPSGNYTPTYKTSDNSFSVNEPKREENAVSVSLLSPREQNTPNGNILPSEPRRESEPARQNTPADTKPATTEQMPDTAAQNGDKPQSAVSAPSAPDDNEPSASVWSVTEQQPPDSVPNQDGENAPDDPPQNGGQNPDAAAPFENTPAEEREPNDAEMESDKPQDNPAAPAKPEIEPEIEPESEPESEPEIEPESEPDAEQDDRTAEFDSDTSEPRNDTQPFEQESDMPPQNEPEPYDSEPAQNNAPPADARQSGEQYEDASPQNEQPRQPEPEQRNEGGGYMPSESASVHNESADRP